jgi:hypothetical protein
MEAIVIEIILEVSFPPCGVPPVVTPEFNEAVHDAKAASAFDFAVKVSEAFAWPESAGVTVKVVVPQPLSEGDDRLPNTMSGSTNVTKSSIPSGALVLK